MSSEDKTGISHIQPAPSAIEPKGAYANAVEDYIDDVNENLEAKIKNPLKGIPYNQLMRDVEAFAHEKGLEEHIPILRKGALVAQTPDNYGEELVGSEALDEAEMKALRDEVEHKWRMPARLFLTIITCSIGAAVQGWDQTGSNGATIFFPDEYGIGRTSTRDTLVRRSQPGFLSYPFLG